MGLQRYMTGVAIAALLAGSAMAQVLILPVLIAVWGIAIAVIVATVR